METPVLKLIELPESMLRDLFALGALVGIISNPTWNGLAMMQSGIDEERCFAVASQMALVYADAMMKARKKGK